MNLSSIPELSLYQLTQQVEPPPQTVVINAAMFKSMTGALIDLLIEQQLETTVWAKLPRNERWFAEIERYRQQGRANKIYQCSTHRATPASSSPYISGSQLIPLVLEASSQLKREYFLLVLSPHFCSLILAQRQFNANGEQSATPSQSQLSLVYSFEPTVIRQVLGGIKQILTITDTTPEELLTDSDLSFPLPPAPDATLLNHLWLKQIQYTERIQASEINSAKSQANLKTLEDSARLKDEFLSNLARELRLPLTNMKTALRLLESKQIKREQRERYLELLHRECDRQSSLLAGLLEFVQLDQFCETESEPSLRLEDLVPGIVSTYQPIAEEKGIQLGYTIPAGFPPVFCPNTWLRQILLSLLNNSLKFTPPNGRVFVQAALKSEYIELTVNDTGVGIESSDLPKIFNSFYRGRNALSSEEMAGAGLGLTIAQYLLNRCGGSISVVSKLGKGSTFKVLLPINTLKES